MLTLYSIPFKSSPRTIWTKSIYFHMNNILLHILLLYYYSTNHDFVIVCIHQQYLAETAMPGVLLWAGLLYIIKKKFKKNLNWALTLAMWMYSYKVQHSKLPPPQKYKQTLTLCPCRFTIQTAVLPRGGRGSDSSPDASRSEERYCSLMGDGNEESESPSLCAFVSFCILSICVVASFWETGSWRGGGELEIVLAPEKLLCSGSVPFDPPPCLKFPWFRRMFFPFISCLVRQNSGQRWYFWGCSGFMTSFFYRVKINGWMESATQPDKYKYLENILLKGALKGGRWRKLICCSSKIFSKKIQNQQKQKQDKKIVQ